MSTKRSRSERKIATTVATDPVIKTDEKSKETIVEDSYDTDSGDGNGKIFIIIGVFLILGILATLFVVHSYRNAKSLTNVKETMLIDESNYVGVDSTDIEKDGTSFTVAASDTIYEDFPIYTFYIVDDATNTVTIINTIFNSEDAVIAGIKNLYPPDTKFTFVHQTEAVFTRESITNKLSQ